MTLTARYTHSAEAAAAAIAAAAGDGIDLIVMQAIKHRMQRHLANGVT